MNKRSYIRFLTLKNTIVKIIIYYVIGDEKFKRGYYYNAYLMTTTLNGNKSDADDYEYPVHEKLIETAEKFNNNKFLRLEDTVYHLYIMHLQEKGIYYRNRDIEYIKDIDNLEKMITSKTNKPEEPKEPEEEKKVDFDDCIKADKNNVLLNDVILNENIKTSIQQVINFVKNKKAYDSIGAKIPKGILLYGPPGTGKTLIAKAIAKETNSSFFPACGSEFIEKYVGVGAKRVRTLFEKARKQSPSIIFIDEIDAVGAKRSSEANNEKEQTLNQLLVELDGFNDLNNITVIAATNRLDLLDSAIIRPGRFDRKIFIDIPNEKNRLKLFELYLSKVKTDNNIDLSLLSEITNGLSGAEIANICNEAAIYAVEQNRLFVTQSDLEFVIDNNKINKKIQKSIGFI